MLTGMISLPKVVPGFTLTWNGMQIHNTQCQLGHQPHSGSEWGVPWSEITKGNGNAQNTRQGVKYKPRGKSWCQP